MKKMISAVALCAALGVTLLASHVNAMTIKPNLTDVGCWLTGSTMGNYGESLNGTWAGGNGYYVSTIDFGDGTSGTAYNGYSTSNTWSHFYAAHSANYVVTLKVNSGGLTDSAIFGVNF